MSIEWVRAENAVYVNGKLFGRISASPLGGYDIEFTTPRTQKYLYLTHKAAKAALMAYAQEPTWEEYA